MLVLDLEMLERPEQELGHLTVLLLHFGSVLRVKVATVESSVWPGPSI